MKSKQTDRNAQSANRAGEHQGLFAAHVRAQRLRGQFLAGNPLAAPEAVVQAQGAVQAQDYAGAKWALGMRLRGWKDADLDQAFDQGRLLRTHILRPTWHFVAPADIRWMLALSGPRVHQANAYYYRQLELDEPVFARSRAVFERELAGGRFMTRDELGQALELAGIQGAKGNRLAYIVIFAELEGLIISGPRRGKQFTYALLEERVAPAKGPSGDEALAELSLRFFAGRGPASVADFVWWSGLTVSQARRGIAAAGDRLHEVAEGFWQGAQPVEARGTGPVCHLLPNYDEYFIGFKDRSAYAERLGKFTLDPNKGGIAPHVVFCAGEIVGGWRRQAKGKGVEITLDLRVPLREGERGAIAEAANRLGDFLAQPVSLLTSSD